LLLVGAAGLASAATLTGPVAAAAASHAAPGRIAAPGSAVATCPGWTALRPPNPGTSTDDLFGVAVLSSSNAWAVGDDSNGAAFHTLIEHWNGTSWKQVPSPNPHGSSELESVSATSATNAWAVGDDAKGRSVTLRWNGSKWTNMVSPNPGDTSKMFAVAASSASNAWAVGEFTPDPSGTEHRTLAFHC